MASRAPLLGVSVCALRGRDVLLVERSRPPFAGLLSLPGGRVEWGEALADAAQREVREETGLILDALDFHRLHEVIEGDRHAVIAVFCAELSAAPQPAAGDDAADARLVAIDELERLESEGATTPGLAAIVRSAAQALRD